MRVPDYVSGAVLFVIAAIVLGMALAFPPAPMGQRIGPAMFPIVISTALMAASLVLIVASVRRRIVGRRRAAFDTMPSEPPDLRGWLVIAAIGSLPVFYMLTVETLGFFICAFLLLSASMLILWNGILRICVIALLAALAIDFVFRGLFGIPLDLGLFHIPWW